ncbi:DUF6538 domain-containing protein [Rhodomicrobium lacus]|uniref:DUF6538 domain-containing protein n=1 Tax=Rhodomicrobium lacus TaxID=2498452 RepID=UPI0026E40673|nr:DUF6538 domain-containing protein [Rhodomicrobium lacus]WKW50618.1 site-specific integrase [Rhodomicrobium lacus]
MILAMARPTKRATSSIPQFRKATPADILSLAKGKRITIKLPAEIAGEPDELVSAKVGKEVTFSLRTRDPALAKARHGAATAQLERHFTAFRSGPQPLTKKQREALAGLLYKAFAEHLEDDPGDVELWQHVQRVNEHALNGKPLTIDTFPGEGRIRLLEARFGGLVNLILQREGVVTDERSRMLLLADAGRALNEAAQKLERNARGDFRVDPVADRFPEWKGTPQTSATPVPNFVSFDDVFERWKRERSPAAVTVTTWKGYVKSFVSYLGHDDMLRVTEDDMIAWKDALVEQGYPISSLRVGRIAAIKALFNYAKANRLTPTNPCDALQLKQKRKAGTRMQAYSDGEVARILALASRESLPYRRWLPWLMATSGARVAELAQLWGQRILKVDGYHVMRISPAEDAGSLKNEGSERDVPIHPLLIEQGFLDFVIEKGEGPLFYKKAVRAKEGGRHASKGVSNHLSQWIREQGFADKRKAPNHAFRHWFKTAMMRVGVLDSVADAIQGHKGRGGEADTYRHGHIETLAQAVAKLKVPQE